MLSFFGKQNPLRFYKLIMFVIGKEVSVHVVFIMVFLMTLCHLGA